jgi:hypothetical protein
MYVCIYTDKVHIHTCIANIQTHTHTHRNSGMFYTVWYINTHTTVQGRESVHTGVQCRFEWLLQDSGGLRLPAGPSVRLSFCLSRDVVKQIAFKNHAHLTLYEPLISRSMNHPSHALWTTHLTVYEPPISRSMNHSSHALWTTHFTLYEPLISRSMNHSSHALWTTHLTLYEPLISRSMNHSSNALLLLPRCSSNLDRPRKQSPTSSWVSSKCRMSFSQTWFFWM